MARGEEREVSIFNMSFLDVFCCTVGALIFILFIQTLRTRDMVERQELRKIQAALAEAKKELDGTEKAITDAERQLGKVKGELEVAQTESKEKDDTIQRLLEELNKPKSPEDSTFTALSRRSSNAGGGTGRAMEAQKTARGQYLLGNLETRPIVCTRDGLYFGMSRNKIPLRNTSDLKTLFRQFLRFHDPKQEGLWRTIWRDGAAAANVSLEMALSESASIGKGLVLQEEAFMENAQRQATSQKIKIVVFDTDGDGFKETQFEDTNGDGKLDLKRINIDKDPFFEEVYLDYNEQRRRWARLLVDSEGDNKYDLLFQDTQPEDSDYELKYVLPNLQTGNAVFRYEDSDNNSIWDTKEENTDMTNPYWEKRYLLFNINTQRWGAISVDTNGDGNADVLWRDTDMSNDDWEEKLVDENGDGEWDIYWKDLDPRDNDWEAKLTQRKAQTDIWQQCELDTNSDGAFDAMLKDVDGDGQWDEEYTYDTSKNKWLLKQNP